MNKRRFAASALVGVSSLVGAVVISPAPAQAAVSYTLSGTGADVSGAWVHGSWWFGNDNRLYVDVNVKDTVADGKSAQAELTAMYSDGGSRYEYVINSSGSGTTKSVTYSFASNVTDIIMKECTYNPANGGFSCGWWAPVFSRI